MFVFIKHAVPWWWRLRDVSGQPQRRPADERRSVVAPLAVDATSVEQMRTGVADWLAVEAASLEEFRYERAERIEDRWARSARFMARMFDAGWNRRGWPVAVGGLGGPAILRNALYDELERAGYRVPEHYVQLEIQGPALMKFAPDVAAKLMPAALRGDEMWSQGFSEPEAGSDLASLRCRAQRHGDEFVVNGQKAWSSYAISATWMGVLTRTGTPESRHRGLTMLGVDLRSPGIEIRPVALANGHNEVAEVFFDNVRVPAENLIGEENGGWAVAMYLLQFERANYGWMRQAHISRRLTELAAHVRDPDRLAAATMGSVWLANLALRARSGATAKRLFAGEALGPEASIDKVLLAVAEQSLNDAYRDLIPAEFEFGTAERRQVWRSEWYHSRAASIYGGAGEVQRGIIADRLLGLPKEG
jgi:alkylation response protein AidB-like acyl-CoA dehydrogenase